MTYSLLFSYKQALIGMLLVLFSSLYFKAGIIGVSSYYWFHYAIVAIVGIASLMSISRYVIDRSRLLSDCLNRIGRHTLDILTWHFLGFKIVSVMLLLLFGLPVDCLSEFPVIREYAVCGWWLIYAFIGVTFPIVIVLTTQHIVKLKQESHD